MSSPWIKRKARLSTLLQNNEDEDAEGLALDRILHGQSVIGKTSKTTEIDSIRFTDRDLSLVGTLEYGQYGVIDVVTCRLDGQVYVRKSIEKRFAFKTRDQCNPQVERDILLRALHGKTVWVPHLLCAFQTPTHLNIVMDYAEGGTLWDVLESSPHDGRVLEADLRWWFPQIVSALTWCHSQGFAHRDVKPHNFVLSENSHVQLIDFGSAAPLLPPRADGAHLIPRRHCLVPCGTCDYISPEILQAHEEALVAFEMTEDDDGLQKSRVLDEEGGYGVETDWWSMGAMLYEMAYGVTPFFADDIRRTYLKIIDHRKSLKFPKEPSISPTLQDFIRRLLTDHETRLGRTGAAEIMDHPFFDETEWEDLHIQNCPDDLHLPQFIYANAHTADAAPIANESHTFTSISSHSQGFPFSAFFQPSEQSSAGASGLHPTPRPNRSILREQASTYFIGFSWGPAVDAFRIPPAPSRPVSPSIPASDPHVTPRPQKDATHHRMLLASTPFRVVSTPARYPFTTPLRPSLQTPHNGMSTLPRASTLRRTAPRRTVSDREAMRQLVDCIGMSARKKVLAAGRTPRAMPTPTSATGTGKAKALRFLPALIDIAPELGVLPGRIAYAGNNSETGNSRISGASASVMTWDEEETSEEGSDAPPSPSPSPRPGSAMSMMSSRRSATPTVTASWSLSRMGLLGAGLPGASSGMLGLDWGGGKRRRSSSPNLVSDLDHGRPGEEAKDAEERELQGKGDLRPILKRDIHFVEAVEKLEDRGRARAVSDALPTISKPKPRPMEKGRDVGDGLGALERRYESLMAEIAGLEGRLAAVRRRRATSDAR